MSGFTISVHNRNGAIVHVPANLEVRPDSWSSSAIGGPDRATINVSGSAEALWALLQWLKYDIEIYNNAADSVWHGFINAVTVYQGAFSAGLSLNEMTNRVRVAYTYNLPDGTAQRGDTDWSTNDESISRYGTKEKQFSLSDTTLSAANEYRNSVLDEFSVPLPVIEAGNSRDSTAIIECLGYWHTLDWQYYTNLEGFDEYDTGNAEQTVGYGFTTSTISFMDETGEMWEATANFAGLTINSVVDISGSASNNGAVTIEGNPQGEVEEYNDSTTTFVANSAIRDTAQTIGTWNNGDVIRIQNTTNNNGYYYIDEIKDAGDIDVAQTTIVNETTSSTITRAYSVKTASAFTEELGASSVTVTARGVQVAQSFTLANNTSSWTVDKIAVKLLKYGAPSDNVKLELRSDNGGVPSNTVLASATIAGSTVLDTRLGWYEFDMGNSYSISYGTTYWIVVYRTGANSATNYYTVGVDENTGYGSGALKISTVVGAWVNRLTDADMPYRIYGASESSAQITNLVTNYAQFIVPDLDSASSIDHFQYRVGDTTSLSELKDLLKIGVTGGRRYIATVDKWKRLIIREEPAKPDYVKIKINSRGELENAYGGRVPLGRLPVGEYVELETPISVDALSEITPYFVERAEYDASNNTTRLEPKGSATLFDFGIAQG